MEVTTQRLWLWLMHFLLLISEDRVVAVRKVRPHEYTGPVLVDTGEGYAYGNISYLIDDVDGFEISGESRLVHHLMRKYRKAGRVARPLTNSSRTVLVEFGLALIQILDFDETNQVLSTNVWKRYRWTDEILMWDPNDFGGISDIRLPSNSVWTPDIVLYNNAAEQDKSHLELVAVYHNGSVRWIPPAIYKSACQIDMRNFPFDKQTCTYKFGSWTYDGNKLALTFYDRQVDLDTREYVDSSEWQVLNTSAEFHERFYPCCGDEPYPDLTFNLTIKRRTAFYVYVLILPSVLLSFLTLVLFWIPPQRPDRTSLGMSLFSSFFVLLLILVQSSPPTSASISLLGLYYCVNMVLIAFSTMLSAIVINLTHYFQRRPVPRIMRMICIHALAKILCAQIETPISVMSREDQLEEEAPMAARICGSKTNGSSGYNDGHKPGRRRNNQADWRIIASVIDRIFFLVFVVGIILSLIFVFPKSSP